MLPLIQITFILTLFVIVFAKQLPNNVIPEEYILKIITNLDDERDTFDFKGSVSIRIKCVSPTDSIVLHSKNHIIDEEKTILKNLNQTGETLSISQISRDSENDFLILKLAQVLQTDAHYEVELHFEDELREDEMGYYRSSYLIEGQMEKWLAVTYFKPDNARRAFPCFDELTFKAQFTISLGRSSRFTSLSNMPLLKTEQMKDKPGWKWDHFQTTPPMSTYLVSFTIMDFKHQNFKEEGDLLRIDFGVWCREGLPFNQDYVDLFASSLQIFETLLDSTYVLPKLDIIAIPDYAVPVMESWGLIIWHEDYLKQISMPTLGAVSSGMGIMADQMSRQIVENLVTIKSWSDSWFLEGLNRYLVSFAEDPLMEGYEWSSVVADNIISVFNVDSLKNSKAILTTPNQAEGVGAEKGFLLIYMLSHFVGQKNLLKTICDFLKMYQYRSAGSAELFELMNKEFLPQNLDVKAVMDTWITKPGFPLITVTRNYDSGRVEVKQERFFRDSELSGTDNTKWWIPLTYTTECEFDFNRTVARKWLSPHSDSVSIKGPLSPGDWMIFNVNASGLYLIDYDQENWKLIINFLNRSSIEHIPSLTGVTLVESAANLAWIGRLDYKIFFDLVKCTAKSKEIQYNYAATSHVYDLSFLLRKTPVHARFVDYVIKVLLNNHSPHLRAKNRISKFRIHRMRGIRGPCKYDMEACVNELVFSQPETTMNYVIAMMTYLSEITCTGALAKNYAWNDYVAADENSNIKFEMLLSLTCANNETLLRNYLEGSLKEETLKSEEIGPIITAVANSGIGLDLVIAFLTENMKTLYDRIFPNVHELSPIIIEMARHIVTNEEQERFKNFINNHAKYFQEFQGGLDDALEIVKLNVQWYCKNYVKVERYFKENYDG